MYSCIERILIVDNCSTDNSYDEIAELKSKKIFQIKTDRNGGYGYGNNIGINYVKNHWNVQYALIANPDVEFKEETLEHALTIISSQNNIGVVSPLQLDSYMKPISDIAWKLPSWFEYTFVDFPLIRRFIYMNYSKEHFLNKEYCEVDCVPGSWLLVKVDAFLHVGGYDEEMFLFGEETTLGKRLKDAGYLTILDLQQEYVHQHSVSINKSIVSERKKYKILVESRLIYIRKYLSKNTWMYYLAKIVYKIVMVKKELVDWKRDK